MQGPSGQASASTPESGQEPVVLAGAPSESSAPVAETQLADAPERSAPAAPPDATAPATTRASAPTPPSDPLEPVNRRIYAVDAALGRAIKQRPKLPPLDAPRSRAAVHAVRNALDNLDEPSVAANDLLQRRLAAAGRTAVRFVINSTIGIAGLVDVAGRLGIKRHDNDLDRTLASYGAPTGPYIYLPVAGPATLRAAVAAAAEGYLYPAHWLHLAAGANLALKGAGYAKLARKVVDHADGAPAGGPSADPYTRTRNAYYAVRTDRSAARPMAERSPAPTLASIRKTDE